MDTVPNIRESNVLMSPLVMSIFHVMLFLTRPSFHLLIFTPMRVHSFVKKFYFFLLISLVLITGVITVMIKC